MLTRLEVGEILGMIPKELLEEVAQHTEVDWNVSRLRGEVMLNLLLYSMLRSDRCSTHLMEHFYATPFFEAFGSKDAGHRTRHSSLADRLTAMPKEYFEQIFAWAYEHFSEHLAGRQWAKQIHRFDSTMISISSALVDWGMRVGRPPKDGPQKMQLKVSVGLKGLLPKQVHTFFDQAYLSEETALYQAILAAQPQSDEWVVFDRGLKGRKKLQKLDLKDIKFVTRGDKNLRYKRLRTNAELQDKHTEELQFIQDSIVHLYTDGNNVLEHEFRLIEVQVKQSGEHLFFITNIFDLEAEQIADIYQRRWDIEVFFRFLKQELNLKHLLNRSRNGVQVQIYVTMLLAILLSVFKHVNNIASFKLAKVMFEDQLLLHLVKQLNRFDDQTVKGDGPIRAPL